MSTTLLQRTLALAALAVGTATAVACGPAPTEPRLAARPLTVAEGAGQAVVAVTLSAPTNRAVTVAWETTPFSAHAPGDYTHRSGTLTIPAGSTLGAVSVPVVADTTDEHDELFHVELGSATGATVPYRYGGVVTIADDDAPPTVSLVPGPLLAREGDRNIPFHAQLSAPSGKDVQVRVRSADGADDPFTGRATAPADYRAVDEVLTILAGHSQQISWVHPLVDDALDEGRSDPVTGADHDHESLTVSLSEPVNVTLGAAATLPLRIHDNDAPPAVSVLDAQAEVEGDVHLGFTVRLSAPSGRDVDVRWETADVTARAGRDYLGGQVMGRLSPGQTSLTAYVTVLEDGCAEPDEELDLHVVPLTPNPVIDRSGRGRITDDGDPEPC